MSLTGKSNCRRSYVGYLAGSSISNFGAIAYAQISVALSSAAYGEVNTGNWATDALANGTIGGIDSSLTGGSFTRGFEFAAAGSLALSAYQGLTGGYNADFGPGQNQPAGQNTYTPTYDGHVPDDWVDNNMFGGNTFGDTCEQSTSLCSQIGNASPSGHAISLAHDNMVIQAQQSIGLTWKNILNFPLMIPAAVLTEAAFVVEYYVPLLNTGRRY